MIRYIKSMLLVSTLVLLPLQQLIAGETIVVIVHKSNTQDLSEQEIKNIYADIVSHWENGKKITVYNMPVESDARESFSQHVLGESAERMATAEYNRKITNTIKNPTKTKSARLIAKLVSLKPNSIGYVPKSMLKDTANVRIVLQIN